MTISQNLKLSSNRNWSWYVLPCASAGQVAYSLNRHSEFSGDYVFSNFVAEYIFQNSSNDGIGHFGLTIAGTFVRRAMSDFIIRILFGSSPSKIFNSVVVKIAIEVPAFQSSRAESDKRFKNDMVNQSHMLFSVFPEIYKAITSGFYWNKHAFRYFAFDASFGSDDSINRFDSTLRRCTINPFESRDFPPAFLHRKTNIGMNRMANRMNTHDFGSSITAVVMTVAGGSNPRTVHFNNNLLFDKGGVA